MDKNKQLMKIVIPLIVLLAVSFVMLSLRFPIKEGINAGLLWGLVSAILAIKSCVAIIQTYEKKIMAIFIGIFLVLLIWAGAFAFFANLYWKLNPI